MEISLLGFLLGLLLMAIPVYIIYAMDLRRMRRFMVSLVKMVAMVVLTGGATYLLVRWNSVVLNILAGIVMAVASAALTIRQANLRVARLLLPVASGLVVASFVVGLYVLFLVVGLKNPFDARFFIPVFGWLTGCSISLNANALHAYYMGLHHHNQLYYYLLGNGSTHREAVNYFVRRSFQAALNPLMKQMSGLVFATAPVLMLALVMGGTDILTAMALQILFFLMVVSASLVSLFLTMLMGRRYSFDAYEKLRPVAKTVATDPQPPISTPDADSSASLSEPLHTDVGSQPQES
ncbi:MAG: ABC transporter permease [Prevotella sp.]|nr:ABC transporter permease [Prevotella sp.]